MKTSTWTPDKKIDYGDRFGRWTALFPAGKRRGQSFRMCICECGNRNDIYERDLWSGHSQSCGCINIDRLTKHGHVTGNEKSPEYSSWQCMKSRCTKPNRKGYHNYGGRGLVFCEQWKDFRVFLEDMGLCPEGCSIDRIDNHSGYYPWNCRWATMAEQLRNRRNNIFLEKDGERLCLKDWATKLGVSYQTLTWRYHQYGNDPDRVLCRPIKERPLYTWNGESLTLIEWSKKTGIKITALAYRFKEWGDIGLALTAPVDKSIKVKK